MSALREPFQLRHVREIVGVFVLGSLAIALVGLLALGEGRRWLERRATVGAAFPADKATVLHPGVPVRLAGERIGEVAGVRVERGVAHVALRVRAASVGALRADSTAILRVPIAGLVGDLAIELTPGGDAPPLAPTAELPGVAQGDLLGEAEGVFRMLAREVPAITTEARVLLEHVNGLLAQAERGRAGTHAAEALDAGSRLAREIERERIVARAGAALDSLDAILASVRAGEGTAGKLVRDPGFHDRVARLLDDVHGSWADLAKAIAAAGAVGEDAAAISAGLRRRADDIPGMMDELERLMLRTNQTLEALQRHWLLRGTFAEPGPRPPPPAVLDRPAPPASPGAPAATPAAGGQP